MPWPPLCYACSVVAAFIVMFFLPLRKLPLALFAVVVFPYLWDKEPGEAVNYRLWKFNIIISISITVQTFSYKYAPFAVLSMPA